MDQMISCVTCEYWDSTNDTWGHCHFHAPRPFLLGDEELENWSRWAVWPRTVAEDFCSNWKQTKKGGK